MADGDVLLDRPRSDELYAARQILNLSVSRCFTCGRLAIWVHNGIVSPPTRLGAEPNVDLPADVLPDYEEARSIVSLSPRGAAALLRLCVQKLCVHLGEDPGDKLDDAIANLVKKGLDVRVQRALDIVRVIGNESVHPGQIDLNDDPGTATELFRLVNLIAEIMITQPKHIEDMYGKLPEAKRLAIERRDKKP
jgi:hypothetical protein